MGLGEFTNDTAENSYYASHPADDKLNEWLDEFEEKFPEPIDVEFVEVSRKMTKSHAKAYWDAESGEKYIRIADFVLEQFDEEHQRRVLIHEMVHVYMYQNGYNYSDHDDIFTWVLGRVGADISGIGPGHEQHDIMMEFLDSQ